jgi:hypothetical protein
VLTRDEVSTNHHQGGIYDTTLGTRRHRGSADEVMSRSDVSNSMQAVMVGDSLRDRLGVHVIHEILIGLHGAVGHNGTCHPTHEAYIDGSAKNAGSFIPTIMLFRGSVSTMVRVYCTPFAKANLRVAQKV